jgi:hypothetical protein
MSWRRFFFPLFFDPVAPDFVQSRYPEGSMVARSGSHRFTLSLKQLAARMPIEEGKDGLD